MLRITIGSCEGTNGILVGGHWVKQPLFKRNF